MKSGRFPHKAERFEVALLEFIRAELVPDLDLKVDADTALFKDGIIDSLKILQLLAFIESAIGRAIPDHEIVMKHFHSVRVMTERFGREYSVNEG
jgi:acyl carrier protein